MNEQVITKKCARCGEEKPLELFYNHAKNADGKHSFCKVCCNASAVASHRKRLGSSEAKGYPELAHISTRALLAEIKARGGHGTLSFTHDVTI